jgi:hypothetical protein
MNDKHNGGFERKLDAQLITASEKQQLWWTKSSNQGQGTRVYVLLELAQGEDAVMSDLFPMFILSQLPTALCELPQCCTTKRIMEQSLKSASLRICLLCNI